MKYLIIIKGKYLNIIGRGYIWLLYKETTHVHVQDHVQDQDQDQVQGKSERAGSGTLTQPIWDKNCTKWV